MIDISRSAGADTVKFVWCPDVDYEGSSRPGKDYVDVMRLDGFTWEVALRPESSIHC